ncbi:HEAT repeat-containing protein 8, partial [Ophiophagus hannah]
MTTMKADSPAQSTQTQTTADFVLLGQLVALLALHISDTSKDGQMSAEAAYHLHQLLMSKMAKEMETKRKNRKGKIVEWLREDFFVSGPAIFYDNIPKMAKAFGEHLTPSQLTDVIMKALEAVTNSNKTISQAAGLLLNSFMKECGMEMEELPMILREMYTCLPNILDPATKEDVIKAVCHLASKRPNRVVDTILEISVECDGTARELWRALVADPYAKLRIMNGEEFSEVLLLPSTETTGRRNSKSIMPIA